MTSLNDATAGAIRAALHRCGIPQAAAAPALGMSQGALSRRLTGHVPITLRELERIAELLGVPVADLLYPYACQPLGETA